MNKSAEKKNFFRQKNQNKLYLFFQEKSLQFEFMWIKKIKNKQYKKKNKNTYLK